jgi:hypothetical protein
MVVDKSGIHHLPLLTCSCDGAGKKVDECVTAGLFPASFGDIRTVFTFGCLDDFRLSNLEAKTSAYQYYQMIRRKTNPAAPMTVPNRYVELRHLSRQWRILQKLKVNGFGHTAEQPSVGDLALFCPSCPQPNVNLPDEADRAGLKYVILAKAVQYIYNAY